MKLGYTFFVAVTLACFLLLATMTDAQSFREDGKAIKQRIRRLQGSRGVTNKGSFSSAFWTVSQCIEKCNGNTVPTIACSSCCVNNSARKYAEYSKAGSCKHRRWPRSGSYCLCVGTKYVN